MSDKKRVLILCTGNSARSQMAEGLLKEIGKGKFAVESAGVAPSSVRPEAVEAMSEIGIDISSHRSKSVDEYIGQDFDFIITVCDNAKETCPVFPGKAIRIHQSFEDPPPATTGDYESRLKIFAACAMKYATGYIFSLARTKSKKPPIPSTCLFAESAIE